MTYYGIDISQHKEYCYTSKVEHDKFQCSAESRNPFMPAALLPEYKHENILLSSEANISRKGLGLLWPREAQIPVGNDWKNGIARVPLLSCLSNIKAAGEADEWKFIESYISWSPHTGQKMTFSNAELLSKVFQNLKDAVQPCFVIPDDFGESAQQTLLEKFPEDTLLIPQSVALAVKWCKDHESEYQNISFAYSSSPSLGFLICCVLGFGEWELSYVEIQATSVNGKVYLIPIYDPNIRHHGISFCGLGLCSHIPPNKNDVSLLWRLVCANAWFDDALEKGLDDFSSQKILSVLQGREQAPLPYPKLEAMSGLSKSHSQQINIKDAIENCIKHLKHNTGSVGKELGVVVGGSFAKLCLTEKKKITDVVSPNSPFLQMTLEQLSYYAAKGNPYAKKVLDFKKEQKSSQQATTKELARFLFPQWDDKNMLFMYGPDVFAQGASIAACCIGEGLPAFRSKLLPLFLCTIRKNSHRDKAIIWECLVDSDTVDAGVPKLQSKPITGFAIQEGKEHLELTLRRPGVKDEQIYRSVIAKIPRRTDRQEPVVITANVRPGQGFAKVNVVSERHGVFSTHLDWRTMKEVPCPELRLEYIPEVASISSDYGLWNIAAVPIQEFIDFWNKKGYVSFDVYSRLLASLRTWRWNRRSSDIFRYIGAINNDGLVDKLQDKHLFETFRKTLLEAWSHSSVPEKKDCLLRVGGWLYLFIPEKMQQEAMNRIRLGDENAVHLHVAGLTFHTEAQFKLFYWAFCRKTEHKTEWYRALRNLVRFRDHALSDEVLTDFQMQIILDNIIYNLSIKKKKSIYNNCIEVMTYLLKRRRYREDLLAAGDEVTIRLRDLLTSISRTHTTEKYRKIAEQTLAFLNKEATKDNLTAILVATGGNDDDGDDE